MVRDMETIGDMQLIIPSLRIFVSICRVRPTFPMPTCCLLNLWCAVKKCQKYHIPKRSETSILRWPFEVRAYVKFRSVVTAWQVESLQSNTQRPDSADQALRLRASFAQICIVVALGQTGMPQIHVMTQGVQFPVAVQPVGKSSSTSLHKSFCILH